jgi:predicted GTPase
LISDKSTCKIGDDISIVLSLNTSDKLINVVDGIISFPEEYFEIKSVKTHDSFLTLWLKKPAASDEESVAFTGGVPHGFNGSAGNVFSFVLKAKKIGEPLVSVSNATILLNDGLGTKLDGVTLTPLKVTITSPKKNAK